LKIDIDTLLLGFVAAAGQTAVSVGSNVGSYLIGKSSILPSPRLLTFVNAFVLLTAEKSLSHIPRGIWNKIGCFELSTNRAVLDDAAASKDMQKNLRNESNDQRHKAEDPEQSKMQPMQPLLTTIAIG
jgi:hypothetical protein